VRHRWRRRLDNVVSTREETMEYQIKIRERRQNSMAESMVHHASAIQAVRGFEQAVEFMCEAGLPCAVIERILEQPASARRPASPGMLRLLYQLQQSQRMVHLSRPEAPEEDEEDQLMDEDEDEDEQV
jgi:hypothetical protein